jgi:hypothetical protein
MGQEHPQALFTFSVFEEIGEDYPASWKIPDRLSTKISFEGIILGYHHKFLPH